MNERPSDSMLSLAANTRPCELPHRFTFAMPRVVHGQRAAFENDELFRKLSRESEVRYTGYRDRPLEERQHRFQVESREGHADLAFVSSGTNLQLNFVNSSWSDRPEDRVPTQEFVNFDLEPGKVHLKSQFILNGVCVVWKGWVDLVRLDGVGCLEFDEERAEVEDTLLREQIEQNNRWVQELEERQRQWQQERQAAAEAENQARTRSGPRSDASAASTSSTTNESNSSISISSRTEPAPTIVTTTTTTATTTSPSSTTLKRSLEELTLITEQKSPSPKSQHSSRVHVRCLHKSKLKELQKVDEEDSEVDVVAVDTDTEADPPRRGGDAEVAAPPRDKIRKSDTIWSPWK